VQIPDNLEEPAHRLMRETAAIGPWANKLRDASRSREARHPADWYYHQLNSRGARVDVWRTTYYHRQAGGATAIAEWFRGSGLRPFLEPLDEPDRCEFLARYVASLEQAYPASADGAVLLPFPRLFFVATRARQAAAFEEPAR
jgi:trans-aconitate 2-methyltransferase